MPQEWVAPLHSGDGTAMGGDGPFADQDPTPLEGLRTALWAAARTQDGALPGRPIVTPRLVLGPLLAAASVPRVLCTHWMWCVCHGLHHPLGFGWAASLSPEPGSS